MLEIDSRGVSQSNAGKLTYANPVTEKRGLHLQYGSLNLAEILIAEIRSAGLIASLRT